MLASARIRQPIATPYQRQPGCGVPNVALTRKAIQLINTAAATMSNAAAAYTVP